MITETNYLGTVHNGIKAPKLTFYSKKIITTEFETKYNGVVLEFNPIITYTFYDTLKDLHNEVVHTKSQYKLKTDGNTSAKELYTVLEDAIHKVKKIVLDTAPPVYYFGQLEIPSFEDTENALTDLIQTFKHHQTASNDRPASKIVPLNRERTRTKRVQSVGKSL